MKRNRMMTMAAIAAMVLLLCNGCATSTASTAAADASAADWSPMAKFHQPRAGLFTGGPPASGAWPAIAASGVTRVIDLRMPQEKAGLDEAGEVRASGMDYLSIPVAGAVDLTPSHAARLWELLGATRGPVLVHCASGNRVGALLALGAAEQGGMTAQRALDFGKSAGLGSLEPQVRELLHLPAAK